MNTAVTVTTSERTNGFAYLEKSTQLLSVSHPNIVFRAVVVNGDSRLPVLPDWQIVRHKPTEDTRVSMWTAFEAALVTKADHLIYCEDDITMCEGALSYIAEYSVPDNMAFVDFCDMTELLPHTDTGLYVVEFAKLHRHKFIGNQCLLFPRRTIEWLIKQDYSRGPVHLRSQSDVALGHLLCESPWPRYGAHVPCLADHVGEISSVHGGMSLSRPGRHATNFPGNEFVV
jgi:hypothetical protein